MSKSKAARNRDKPIVHVHLPADTALMPDGRPLPDICTAEEVLHYLRMGEVNPGGVKKQRSLQPLREKGWLVGFRSGRNIMYTKQAVLDCRRIMEEKGAA